MVMTRMVTTQMNTLSNLIKNKRRQSFFWLVVFLSTPPTAFADSVAIDRVAAIVNDGVIFSSQLEERLARVEKELKELKATVTGKPEVPWWQEIDGGFAGDPVFAEIVRLGAQIRKRDGKGLR